MIRRRIHREVPHVWSSDPSLDLRALGAFDNPEGIWQKFLKTGDVASLPLANGEKPAVFKLQSLTRAQWLMLGDLSDRESMLRRHDTAVSYGLVGVTGFLDGDGRPLELAFEDSRNGKRLTAETLDALFYPDLILELGARVLVVSRPDPT